MIKGDHALSSCPLSVHRPSKRYFMKWIVEIPLENNDGMA